MAEALLRKKLLELGRTDIEVASMGVYAVEKQKPPQRVLEVCSEHGLDLSQHSSRPLHPSELKDAAMIFVMETVQKHFLTMFFPHLADRVVMLGAGRTKRTPNPASRTPWAKTSNISIRPMILSPKISIALHRSSPICSSMRLN